ncbi:MAG: creatininase family protein [Balneolaceae bacterium]|nr:MAG: creatininase family protein [Balneolaceae bacterium]
MRPYILAENNWRDIRDMNIEVALLPWGATEAHNTHLPYATDNFQVEELAAEAGRIAHENGAGVIVLPAVPFGVNTGQADIRLDMNLNPSTQLSILRDLITVLNRQKIHKFLLLNGHGGNNFKPLLRELGLEFPDMFLSLCDWFQIAKREISFRESGDHADEMETSLMMKLRPGLVQPLHTAGEGKAKVSVITGITEGWAWAEREWSKVTADTGIGNPKYATPEKGEEVFRVVSGKIAVLISEIASMKMDQRYRNPE